MKSQSAPPPLTPRILPPARTFSDPVLSRIASSLKHGIYKSNGKSESNQRPQRLTLAADIRTLPEERANKVLPVVLCRTVTWSCKDYPELFVQDSSGGIFVLLPSSMAPIPPKVGEEVEIIGETAKGVVAPFVRPRDISVLGRSPLPSAKTITLDHAMTGAEDSQWVELQG
jgi:hypothetical protein